MKRLKAVLRVPTSSSKPIVTKTNGLIVERRTEECDIDILECTHWRKHLSLIIGMNLRLSLLAPLLGAGKIARMARDSND